jgi:hypothetical protein
MEGLGRSGVSVSIMARVPLLALIVLGCSSAPETDNTFTFPPVGGSSPLGRAGASSSGGSSSQVEGGSGGEGVTGGDNLGGSSGASTMPQAGSGGSPTPMGGSSTGGAQAGQPSGGAPPLGGQPSGGMSSAGSGGKPDTCQSAPPYLKAVPRTVTTGPIYSEAMAYPFGTILTTRDDITKPYHFQCMVSPQCKGLTPNINTVQIWHWVEQGTWVCDMPHGWSNCAQYLVGDFITYESGTDYLCNVAYAVFRCEDEAGCRAHAPKAFNGDEHWRYYNILACP